MTRRCLVLAAGLFALAGCSETGKALGTAVDVTVTVTGPKPLGKDVTLMLQPTEQGGYPAALTTTGDGKFAGKAIPGKYAYYFAGKGDTAPKGVPERFTQTTADHTVQVAADTPGTITLN